MGSANVQVLRRLEELFNTRDLDEYVLLLDPAIEWHVAREDPDTTVHRGRGEVRTYVEGWIEAFADLQIRVESAAESGDCVTTVIRFTGHGTGSGVTLDERIGFVWTFRDGRVTKVEDQGRDQASTK